MAYSEEFFIHVQGEQKGPYTFPQLKRLYDGNLIPEETLYWREGMEQLEHMSDICGTRRKDRLRYLKHWRLTGIILVGAIALVTAYCEPVLKDAWREMNDLDQTQEGAYWKARGFVRELVKKQEQSVAFEPYEMATVALTGTEATVIMPSTLFRKDGAREKKTWRVVIQYDAVKKEWRLPAP